MTAATPPGPRDWLEELEALREKATPGPWDAEICEGELTVSAGSARTVWTEHDGFRLGDAPSSYRATDRIYEQDLDDWDGGKTLDDKQREADADLIVAAVNALPALVGALRAVEREADDLRAEVTRLVRANPARGSYDDGLKRGMGYAHDRIRAALAAVRRDGAGT